MTNEVTIHVKAKDHTKGDFAGIERNANNFGNRLKNNFGKQGAHSGAAFAAGFIKTITLGMVGSGFAQASMRMAPRAAHFGGVVGVGMAAGLVMKMSSALSALLPLALGGIFLAGPVAYLMKGMMKADEEAQKYAKKTEALKKRLAAADDKDVKERLRKEIAANNEMQKALEKRAESWTNLKSRAKDFMDYISKPVIIPLAKAMDAIGDGLERIKKPFRSMLETLAPALVPFTKGVMKGVENFIAAIEPKMPAIAAGFKAWGKASAEIGKSLGEFLAKIMEDPEATIEAVAGLAKEVKNLAKAAAQMVESLAIATEAYGRFAEFVNEQEGKLQGDNILLPKPATVRAQGNAVIKAYRWVTSRISAALDNFVENHRPIAGQIRGAWNRVVSAITGAVSRAISAIGRFASGARTRFNQVVSSARNMGPSIAAAFNRIVSSVRSAMSRMASAVSSGASRVVAMLRSLGSRIRGAFAGAGSWLVGAGRSIITGLISGIRSAAGAAAAAARSVVQRAAAAARAAIPGLATGGIVGGLSHAAEGGPKGGAVLVGEHGPEIVNLPLGSHVNSNPDSQRMMAGRGERGGDTHFHFHGPVYGDHNALRHALVTMHRRGELDVVLR